MDKNVIFKINYGLYIMSVRGNGGKDNGCIINTVMQVTDSPLRISVTINKESLTGQIASETGQFNISILSKSAPFSIFKKFGFQSGRNADKFMNVPTKRSENGIVYLTEDVSAYMSCKVVNEIDLGTHKMFISDLVDAKIISNAEPVTYSYYQKEIKPSPKKTNKKGWRCVICGYIYEGEDIPEDFICPLCKHGVVDFVKIA